MTGMRISTTSPILAPPIVYRPIPVLRNMLHTSQRLMIACLLLYKVLLTIHFLIGCMKTKTVVKRHVSPLLPRSCRFIPSCSEYAIQSLQQFGLQRGLILTIWRLLRCQPCGGYGYDPPQWPPPSWFQRGY